MKISSVLSSSSLIVTCLVLLSACAGGGGSPAQKIQPVDLSVHQADQCPMINGDYSNHSQHMHFTTVTTEGGVLFTTNVESPTIIDGKYHSPPEADQSVRYVGACSAGTMTLDLYKSDKLIMKIVLSENADGSVSESAQLDNDGENKIQSATIKYFPEKQTTASGESLYN